MEKDKKKIIVATGIIGGGVLLYLLIKKAGGEEPPPDGWPPPAPDPDKATVYGVVLDTSYKVYPNITVEYRSYGLGTYTYSVVTNKDGRYVIKNISPGGYVVQLYTSAGDPCGWRGAELPAGQATSVNIITTLGGW